MSSTLISKWRSIMWIVMKVSGLYFWRADTHFVISSVIHSCIPCCAVLLKGLKHHVGTLFPDASFSGKGGNGWCCVAMTTMISRGHSDQTSASRTESGGGSGMTSTLPSTMYARTELQRRYTWRAASLTDSGFHTTKHAQSSLSYAQSNKPSTTTNGACCQWCQRRHCPKPLTPFLKSSNHGVIHGYGVTWR